MKKRLLNTSLFFALLILTSSLIAQDYSPANGIHFKNIGPTVFGGRIVDLDVNPTKNEQFLAATASGGLWFSPNMGASFEPIFDNQSIMTIGDIAANWKTQTIYLGSGEVNSSRSSLAGNGVYKSTDWGKTWSFIGLKNTQHIGRIIIHPSSPETVWVASLGQLYDHNKERGIYKTTDGGKTWKHTLFINDSTGIVDLTIDPKNPDILLASAWERTRKAWTFKGSGKSSALYKSIDGGDTWNKLNSTNNGLPTGTHVGRMGVDIHHYNNQIVYYMVHDNQEKIETKEDKNKLSLLNLKSKTTKEFLNYSVDEINDFLESVGVNKKFSAEKIIQKVKSNELSVTDIYTSLIDANTILVNGKVKGLEVYKSMDEGKTWAKTHDGLIEKVYNTYGYYFGQIKVSPINPNRVIVAGVPCLLSDDGGKTFSPINADNMHVDHHAIWMSDTNQDHIIMGNDGGVNYSFDAGKNYSRCTHPPLGQFYSITLDNETPFNVYGGLQDNGVWKGASTYKESNAWQQYGEYPYERIMGGDGMQTQVDNRNSDIVYTGFQFGYYYRLNLNTNSTTSIRPFPELGNPAYRFNWQTPILLSEFNQDVIYMGAQKLLRSVNQGEDWEELSNDLTNGGIAGNVPFGTITCINESHFSFGKLYVGTDDGNIWRNENGGSKWTKINNGLPKNLWVSSLKSSTHTPKTIYATLNGYRNDDTSKYAYKSTDDGNTWVEIGSNLPNEAINVITEDPIQSNIIYIGTDQGLYISTDSGKSFSAWTSGLPGVSIHDIKVHARDKKIVLGTHGRSIYIADVAPIHKMVDLESNESVAFLSDSITTRVNSRWGEKNYFAKQNQPDVVCYIYSNTKKTESMKILDSNNQIAYSENIQLQKGINTIPIPCRYDSEMVKKNNLDKADDGNSYFKKGNYSIKVANQTLKLELK